MVMKSLFSRSAVITWDLLLSPHVPATEMNQRKTNSLRHEQYYEFLGLFERYETSIVIFAVYGLFAVFQCLLVVFYSRQSPFVLYLAISPYVK